MSYVRVTRALPFRCAIMTNRVRFLVLKVRRKPTALSARLALLCVRTVVAKRRLIKEILTVGKFVVCAIDFIVRLSFGYGINLTVVGLGDAPPDGSVVVC